MAISEIKGEDFIGVTHADERDLRHHKVIKISCEGGVDMRCQPDS